MGPGMRVEQDLFAEGRLPDRHDLDAISDRHPIVLARVCGHCLVANSLAMQVKGVGPGTRLPRPAAALASARTASRTGCSTRMLWR